jgi:hypothetical protein
LSAQDWAIMREIVDAENAVPDAANRPAGQVLEYVRAMLRVMVTRAAPSASGTMRPRRAQSESFDR